MPWWTTLVLMALGTYLWLSGRSNPDDVIGLLEQMLAIALALVVLFVGHNLLIETLALVVALVRGRDSRISPSSLSAG